ncbi:LON peptidase substrate-binding domain-containing protein, partial [Achromobacter xylosoxidans]|nr:LON peptidase substrate-binding domain-containing protein [Achromobacter xylosoxidans]
MATIPLFPLSNALFPAGVLHLRIFEVRYLDMIRRCIADGTEFGVVALLAGNEVRSPEGQEVLADVGTLARIDAWDAPM